MTNHTYKLIYFDTRGRAEAIRLVFKYFDVPFEDSRLTKEEWAGMKPNLQLHQLPCLDVDNGKWTLFEANAIGRYLAKALRPESYFAGSTKPEAARCDMFVDYATDFLNMMIRHHFAADDNLKEAAKTAMETSGREKLVILEENLKNNGGDFLLGKKLLWCDLLLATVLSALSDMGFEEMLKERTDLNSYYLRIRNLPEISAYVEEHWPKITAPE